MSVTLLTATLPERQPLLAEAMETVLAQSRRPDDYRVGFDLSRKGAAWTYNSLADGVETEWLTFLDDDDLLDPDHLETLLAAADADVVYAGCRSAGRHFGNYNEPFDRIHLARRSIVPITALVRTELFHAVGGFPDVWGYDWRLWQRIADRGASFHQVKRITWTYRLDHGYGNQSLGDLA